MTAPSRTFAPVSGLAGGIGDRALGTVLALSNLSVVVIIDHGAGAI
ncbi:hypothetical protein [Mesoterricola silvestris]|uniref:Uncharacterized protein n=1 Tax=Mesoterricola silvestris TaxID=2927979 RepID=A0AA48K9K6_9BACT|nr:hypothetical protein [Mesoterricola silvestris]BDU74089.1 hypothetical protein METEAL_32630 [Mesoterricola silvestris]